MIRWRTLATVVVALVLLLAVLVSRHPYLALDTTHVFGTFGSISSCASPPCLLPTTKNCDGASVMYVEIQETAATAEVDEQLHTDGSYTTNANQVSGTSTVNLNQTYKMTAPAGAFSVKVTAFTGGTVAANWECVWTQIYFR